MYGIRGAQIIFSVILTLSVKSLEKVIQKRDAFINLNPMPSLSSLYSCQYLKNVTGKVYVFSSSSSFSNFELTKKKKNFKH